MAPGGYPPEAPTDPDMRISRIRLLRIMGSLRDETNRRAPAGRGFASLLSAAVLLRRCLGSKSHSSFPPAVPCSDAPFPPQGPLGRFPRFSGTMRHSDCSPTVSPHFVSFAWRYRHAPTCSLLHAGEAPRASLGFGHRSPDRMRLTETTSSPGFPGNPREHAMDVDPVETPAPAIPTAQRCCLRPK